MRLLLALLFATVATSLTVQQAVTTTCETSVVAGLSSQIVNVLNQLNPGAFTDIRGIPGVQLSSSAQPYLQTAAANSLRQILATTRRTITLNSALRTLPQQVLIYHWFRSGHRCGIQLAAKVGLSNHQAGAAIDTPDYSSWIRTMQANGWKWFGNSDRVHFDFVRGDQRFKAEAVRAFQKLWNINNPTRRIPENGVYSAVVENAILLSPVSGFPIGSINGGQAAAQGDQTPAPDAQQQQQQPAAPASPATPASPAAPAASPSRGRRPVRRGPVRRAPVRGRGRVMNSVSADGIDAPVAQTTDAGAPLIADINGGNITTDSQGGLPASIPSDSTAPRVVESASVAQDLPDPNTMPPPSFDPENDPVVHNWRWNPWRSITHRREGQTGQVFD